MYLDVGHSSQIQQGSDLKVLRTKSSFTIFVIFAYFGKVRQKKEGVYSIQYSRYLYQKRFLIWMEVYSSACILIHFTRD